MSFQANMLGRLAYYQHLRGNLDKAETLYAQAMDKGMTLSRQMGTYGVLLLRKGNFEPALHLFDRALQDKSLKPDLRNRIRMNRALCYLKLGDTQRAVVALEDLHENYRSTRVYQTLGYVYILAGMLDKALEYNLEALDYAENDPVILDNLGQLYYQQGDLANARKYLEDAYQVRDNQVDILYHLSCVEEDEGNLERALELAARAVECRISTLNDVTPAQVDERYQRLKQAVGPQDNFQENGEDQ